MRFEIITPTEGLKPFVWQLVISEMAETQLYKVFPSTGMVCGFQYRGALSMWQNGQVVSLSAAGISGLASTDLRHPGYTLHLLQ
jgi:hypothetical protein